MALTQRRSRPVWSRLHFAVRVLGLFAFLSAVSGIVLMHVGKMFAVESDASAQVVVDRVQSVLTGREFGEDLRKGMGEDSGLVADTGEAGEMLRTGVLLFAFSASVVLIVLLVELGVMIVIASGRRSAAGTNFVVQVGLAAALLIGINVFAFQHSHRWDCTRPNEQTDRKSFTLHEKILEKLAGLRGETTIVVLQQRKKGTRGEGAEDYATAGENVVVEKVRDLADLLRHAGAKKLEIVQLDARNRDFRSRLAEVTKNRDRLGKAIAAAPGNSIIFYSGNNQGGDVQTISFDDFRQLDLTLSRKGDGNLVLLDKGLDAAVRRIFNLEEKRPRIALLVAHEVFGSDAKHPLGHLGLKKSLVQNGFEVRDILLKRNHRTQGRGSGVWEGETTVSLVEENKYLNQRARRDRLPTVIRRIEANRKFARENLKNWEEATLADLRRQIARIGFEGTAEQLRQQQRDTWKGTVEALEREIADRTKELADINKELDAVNADVVEQQTKDSDLPGKLARALADCDMVMIVRPPIWPFGYADNGSFHRLDDFQIRAIRDVIKSGKPFLACLSSRIATPPPFAPPGTPPPPPPEPDGLETLLSQLEIRLGKDTLVYPTQTVDRRADSLGGEEREVPALDLLNPLEKLGKPQFLVKTAEVDNPIRRSLALAHRSSGNALDLRLPFPRPVYHRPRPAKESDRKLFGAPPPYAAEFLWTQATAWNTDDPENAERFDPPKADDPTRDSLDEKRQGAFPIGVAVETEIPSSWLGLGDKSGTRTRLAVIGSGTVFAEPELPTAREKLLLDTCNWLLGRDDLLSLKGPDGEDAPSSDGLVPDLPTWSYPRLDSLSSRDKALWQWFACLGLPSSFACLGVVVLLWRRIQ